MRRGHAIGASRVVKSAQKLMWLVAALAPGLFLASSCITPTFSGLGAGGSGMGGDAGTQHCYDTISNSGETGIDCGGKDCDGCEVGGPCRNDIDCESNSCRAGKCRAPTCDDQKINSDETGPDCGGKTCDLRCDVKEGCAKNSDCLAPPAESSAGAECITTSHGTRECALSCPPRSGDCNQSAADGCEEPTETSLTHCGECFKSCDLEHVSHSLCVSGGCKVDTSQANDGCDPGYSDCDGISENGCEAKLASDVAHCGECNRACSDENGKSSCVQGECGIACKSGFEDCNNDARADGCETNITSSVNDCGGCGEVDETYVCKPKKEGESPYCAEKKCGSVNCEPTNPGNGACDGDKVCDDPLDTVANCGVCGQICVVTGGIAACRNKLCTIGECNESAADCDGDYMSGCEVDVTSNKRHCGGCTEDDPRPGSGSDCTLLEANEALHVLTTACNGTCQITSCEQGYGDCDGKVDNGCEVNLLTSDQHCGACTGEDARPGAGENCDKLWERADGSCLEGVCNFEGCAANFEDCGGDPGCETDLSAAASCGNCATRCGGEQTHLGTEAPTCSASGKCQVVCDGEYCPDLADPERPCTSQKHVAIVDCTVCGETCGGSHPFCDPALGCRQLFPVQVVGTVTARSASNGSLTTTLALTSPTTTRGRAVVVAIQTPRALSTVRLSGVNMTQAVATPGTGDVGYSYVYYVQGASLGAPGNKTLEVTATSGWGGIIATPMELINVSESTPSWTAATRADDNPCIAASGGVYKLRQTAEVNTTGSLVFSSLMVRAGTKTSTATATGLPNVSSAAQIGQQGQGWSGYDFLQSDTDVALGWDVNGGDCWNIAVATVVLSPVIEKGP